MTVLVRDPLQQFKQRVLQMMMASFVKSGFCGIILAKCTNANPRYLVQLQSRLGKLEPGPMPECFFDDQSRILAVVLEGRRLPATHYMSLACKEYLERHALLNGQVLVASFPESGEPSEAMFNRLFQSVASGEGEGNDIRLFVEQPLKSGVTSILVADTEQLSREFIKLRLELKGYEVFEARDGSEALEKFSIHSPDLVITELNLPVLDGYQLIRNIKKERSSKGKVIVLTDKHLTKNMNRAFELGASDYVTKPFSFAELEWRIKKLSS